MSEHEQRDAAAANLAAATEAMQQNFQHIQDLVKDFVSSKESKSLDPLTYLKHTQNG